MAIGSIIQGSTSIIGGLVSGGIKAAQLGERIEREASEKQFQFDNASFAINQAESAFVTQRQKAYSEQIAQLGQANLQSLQASAQNFERFGVGELANRLNEQAQNIRALQNNISEQNFALQESSARSSLYNQRVQFSLADYEQRVAQDRLRRKSTLQAQSFFTSLLGGVTQGASAVVGGSVEIGVANRNRIKPNLATTSTLSPAIPSPSTGEIK